MLFVQLTELNIIRFRVCPSETIGNVKAMIALQANIPTDQQRLSFMGRKLKDGSKKLSYYNIVEECTIRMD
jgi:ubiquitin-small subunit ribosomal protein S27Ae